MMDVVCDIACGTVAGMCAKTVEYPLDTIKVRVQSDGSPYKGYLDCARRMLNEEGFRSFYRGIGAPMAGGGAENAVCFGAYGRGQILYRWMHGGYKEEAELPLSASVFSGLIAGVGVSHVLTPVELLKCRMQLQNMLPKEKQEFTGVLDCARKTIKKGGLPALFDGHTATLAREVPGNAAWFGFYNMSLRAMTPEGHTKADLPGWKVALAGAIGGVTYWTAFFPADVVKTRMQTDAHYKKLGLVKGLGVLWKEEGIRGLYKGWSITAVRAFPANAIIFYVYEMCAAEWHARLG